VQFANELQRGGLSKLAAVAQAARIRLRTDHDDEAATFVVTFLSRFVSGRCGARNSIGLVLVGGHDSRNDLSRCSLCRLYMLIAKEHHEGRLDEPGRGA
jgi:multidrug efflux pump